MKKQTKNGKTLRTLREAGRVKQQLLAEALGMSPGHLSRLESGAVPLSNELLARAVEAIEVLAQQDVERLAEAKAGVS